MRPGSGVHGESDAPRGVRLWPLNYQSQERYQQARGSLKCPAAEVTRRYDVCEFNFLTDSVETGPGCEHLILVQEYTCKVLLHDAIPFYI